MKQLLRKKKYSLIFIFLKILNFNFTHKIILCNKYNIEQFSYIYSRITTLTSNSSYWLKYVTTIHFNDVRKKKKKSKCSYENCVHIPRHDNKVTRPCNLLTRELKLNGGQADFYSGTRRAHKADGIAGSKFEIFCRHFSSLRPRPLSLSLSLLSFFSSPLHTVFWHAFQSGWLPRKPRNRSVTRTIEEVKGDCDSFSNGNDRRAMTS